MTQQITSSPSTKKISDLIGLIRRNELILQPEFQRNLVWNARHKESFIDTILCGYPFPEIYIAQSGVNLDTLATQQVIVDGQQRLSSIMEYVDGKASFCHKIQKFAELPDEKKIAFLNYDVVVRDLKDASSEVIKEIFRRINQTKYNLSPIEIQHAIYDGEFISTANDILNNFDKDKLPIFNEMDTARMSDLNFILLIMATIEEGGYFSGNSLTEAKIISYNDYYPNKDSIKEKITSIINKIITLNLAVDSMWFRKSNFFTLIIELSKIDGDIPEDIKDRLVHFENMVMQDKDNGTSDGGKYYSMMYTGTNKRSSRIERGVLLKKYVIDNVN